uniref:Fucosyltransferase n=1 Tax=Tetranychus urticae TaxID=32264 RepID=T1KLF5_TETUR
MQKIFTSFATSKSSSRNASSLDRSTLSDKSTGQFKVNQQVILNEGKHCLYPGAVSRPYVGLSLPSWYRPKASSTILRRRLRSRQWVTYQVEVTPDRKRPRKSCLSSGVKIGQSEPRNSGKMEKSSNPKYHLVHGYVSDVEGVDAVTGEDEVDSTEPHQKVKLIVLLLMIPSIAVMFYSQTKFRRESNVVGDLSGLGLPPNYLSSGIGSGSFGSRDFNSRFNPIYDHQMRSEHADEYDPFDNAPNEKDQNDYQNDQQSNENEQLNSGFPVNIFNDEFKDENKAEESKSIGNDDFSKEMYSPEQMKIMNLKTVDEYKVIFYENNDPYNVNHLSLSNEFPFSHCTDEKRCLITNDVTLINISDALIFTDPNHPSPNKLKSLSSSTETTLITIFYQLTPTQLKPKLNYNLTLTYSHLSNITYRPFLIEKSLTDGVPLQSSNSLSSENVNGSSAFNLWRNKRKLVLIVTSNCTVDQLLVRMATIMERIGIDVDLVSLCDYCPKLNKVTEFSLEKVSLESCLETLFEPYLFLFDWQPYLCCFINALDFTSLHDLGDLLNLIASDLNQYQSYIKWTETHEISMQRQDLCSLCSYLHGNHSVINKMSSSYTNNSECVFWKKVYSFSELS